MKRLNFGYGLAGSFLLLSLVVYSLPYFLPYRTEVYRAASNLIAVGSALMATIAVYLGVKSFSEVMEERKSWQLINIGLILFLLGELSWAIQEIFLRIKNPFPSIADFFWLLGYLPFFVGLILREQQLRVPLYAREKLFLASIILVIITVSSFFLFLPIANSNIGIVEKFLDIAYPLGDLALIIPVFSIMIIFGKHFLGRPWMFIALGLALIGIADTIFSYLTWYELYWKELHSPTNLVDLLWVAGYLTMALGGFYQAEL